MDKKKIIKDLEFCVNGHFKVELSLATKILALLKEQPEIVRCKACKWYSEKGFCKHPNGGAGNVRPADWFCADGERR